MRLKDVIFGRERRPEITIEDLTEGRRVRMTFTVADARRIWPLGDIKGSDEKVFGTYDGVVVKNHRSGGFPEELRVLVDIPKYGAMSFGVGIERDILSKYKLELLK